MKNHVLVLVAGFVLIGSVASFPAQAGELLSSPLYSSSAAFDSLSNSSDMVAEGDYQIVRIEPAQTREGYAMLTLKNQDIELTRRDFKLLVPTANVETAGLQDGQTVSARKKPYGMVFTTPGNQTFAIVLNDAWQKEMAVHKVL